MPALNHERDATEHDHHAGRDGHALVGTEVMTADVAAVRAADVTQNELGSDRENRMATREPGVVDPDVALDAATDGDLAGRRQAEGLGVMSGDDEEAKAAQSLGGKLSFRGPFEHALILRCGGLSAEYRGVTRRART